MEQEEDMDLDEMRKTLEGDAQRALRSLEKSNEHLVRVIRRKEDIIKDKNRQLRVLYSRCAVLSRGTEMCRSWCALKKECERMRVTE